MRLKKKALRIFITAIVTLAVSVSLYSYKSRATNVENNHEQTANRDWIENSTYLSLEQLKILNAKNFIELLKEHTVVIVGDSIASPAPNILTEWNSEIVNWPHKNDIPLLLSLVESDDPCAKTLSGIEPVIHGQYSTVGYQSLVLLYAIKQGKFNLDIQVKDKQSLIAWAREEAKKLEAAP